MSATRWRDPVISTGVLGWGNRKSGLEAYGPGGRWHGTDRAGDLLGDSLNREGAFEGMPLVVVAVDRYAVHNIASLVSVIEQAVMDWHSANSPQGAGQ